MKRTCLALLLLVQPAFAVNTGVLIDDLPDVTRAQVLAAVREALTHRRWTIDATTESSVSATISRKQTTARITLSIAGDSLVYEEESARLMSATKAPNAGFVRSPVKIKLGPWIENLRVDVRAALAGTPLRSESASDRLMALDSMRSDGLITEQEHADKRAEILGDL